MQSCLNLFTVSHTKSRLLMGTKTKGMGETPLAAALQPPQVILRGTLVSDFFPFSILCTASIPKHRTNDKKGRKGTSMTHLSLFVCLLE